MFNVRVLGDAETYYLVERTQNIGSNSKYAFMALGYITLNGRQPAKLSEDEAKAKVQELKGRFPDYPVEMVPTSV